MRRTVYVLILMLLAGFLAFGIISASTATRTAGPDVVLKSPSPTNGISNETLRVVKEVVARQVRSGQLAKYAFPTYADLGEELEVGDPYPVYSLLDANDPGLWHALSEKDFGFSAEVKEWLVYIFPKGSESPAFFTTILAKDGRWIEGGFGSADVFDLAPFEQLKSSHDCTDYVFFRFQNEFGLSFSMDGVPMVMPSSLLLHELRIPGVDVNKAGTVVSLQEFVEYANVLIDEIKAGTSLDG